MSEYEMQPIQSAQKKEAGAYQYGSARSQTGVRRLFSFTQMFFFALSYMYSWEALATNVGLVFYNGGPRAMVWGFCIVIPGVLCQVASIAEMSSVQPIAGAQYHWTWHFAPPTYRKPLTWLQGWLTWFSWVALMAGGTNISANIITVIVSANSPGYVAQGWHVILIMYAFLIVCGFLAMYAFWIIPWLELLAGLLHIVLWIVFAVVLLTLSERHTDGFVWWQKANLSGWDSDFVSFNLGIILITWGFVGFDAFVHISEETRKARSAIPRAMFWSICMNAAMAFGMILIFLYCCGDVDTISAATYPLMDICLAATNSVAGASAMIGMILLGSICGTFGSIASTSRITWAWARDGVLPAYFAYVDPKHRVPLRASWLPIIMTMLLALLNLANYTAFSVIVSLSTFGLYQSYFIAISCMLHARWTGRHEEAPWSLGKWGIPINIFAIAYSAWLGIFMVFPVYLPITAAYMNYALPINALVWVFAAITWFTWGRKRWPGLNVEVIDKVVADGDRDTKD